MKTSEKLIDFLARVLISAIFINSVPGKITNFSDTVLFINSRGIDETLSTILLIAAIICLIIGSALFLFGKHQIIGASLLLIFLIPTTIIFHTFPFETTPFLANTSIIGALIITIIRNKAVTI